MSFFEQDENEFLVGNEWDLFPEDTLDTNLNDLNLNDELNDQLIKLEEDEKDEDSFGPPVYFDQDDTLKVQVQPMQQYEITQNMNYNYQLQQSQNIHTNMYSTTSPTPTILSSSGEEMETKSRSSSRSSSPSLSDVSKPRRRKRKREEIEQDNARLEELKRKKNKSKEEKSELRKLRNRWSAQKSRNKKRKLMEDKDEKIRKLEEENEMLRKENRELKKQLYERNDENYNEKQRKVRKKRKASKSNRKKVLFGTMLLFGFVLFGFLPAFSNIKDFTLIERRSTSITGREILSTRGGGRPTQTNEKEIRNYSVLPDYKYDNIRDDDSKIKKKSHFEIDPHVIDSTEMNDFESYLELIIPKEVKAHFHYEKMAASGYSDSPHNNDHYSTNTTHNTIDIIEDDEDVSITPHAQKDDLEDERGALMPFGSDGDNENEREAIAYMYKKDIDDQTLYLLAPHVYPLYSTKMDYSKDQKIVLVYPTDTYNTSTGKFVHKLSGIEAEGVTFSDYYISFDKLA